MFIVKRRDNEIVLRPESNEDLWHLEKIVKQGDKVRAITERKREEASGTTREKMRLTLEIDKTEFHKGYRKLKILGTILEGPEDLVSLGSHHSFYISPFETLTIIKEKWSKHELDRLKQAKEESKQPKITVTIMDERKAEVFTIKQYGLEKKGEMSLPGRGKYAETEGIEESYKQVLQIMKRTEKDKYVVAGPGFEGDNFMKYLEKEDPKMKKKVSRVKTNNIGQNGVYEIIREGKIDKILLKSRLKRETKAIDELIRQIASEEGNATYGRDEVEKAIGYGAVEKLVVLDEELFKNEEKVNKMMEKTEQKKGKTIVVSKENPESQKLRSLGGIGAILRYKVN